MTNIAVSERVNWVGASESAALFGVSPYTTRYELWHQKAGNIPPPDLDDVERVQAGNFLEAGIGAWAAHRWGWKIRNVEAYEPHPTVPKMGCSLDWETEAGEPVEIKNVDNLVFRNPVGDWEADGDTITGAPVHFLIQIQHQLACRPNAACGWLLVCVGGNKLYRMAVERHPAMIGRIESEVAAFWKSIEDGIEPTPDFLADAGAIAALYHGDGDAIDLRGNNRAAWLAAEYLAAHADEKRASDRKTAALAELKLMMAGAREALIDDGYRVKASFVKGGTYTRKDGFRFGVTQQQVGVE